MFSKYYHDELSFLRELGGEFAAAHPQTAHLLSERGADPDVERLIEAFAFIAGHIREKIDDELPELTHTLFGILWPHYLRPVPSMTIMEFRLRRPAPTTQIIPTGTIIRSRPVDGAECVFRTGAPVALSPLTIEDSRMESSRTAAEILRLRFSLAQGATLKSADLKSLMLHLHGEPQAVYPLYTRLLTRVERVVVHRVKDRKSEPFAVLESGSVSPWGFGPEAAILPYPGHAFPGYRILQEYFAFPEKFHFVELGHLEPLRDLDAPDGVFEITFEFKSSGRSRPPQAHPGNIRLHCAPAINLFQHDADPIMIDQSRTEYRLRPRGDAPHHHEIYSVDEVSGIEQGTARKIIYQPFNTFSHAVGAGQTGSGYFQPRRKESAPPPETRRDSGLSLGREMDAYSEIIYRESPLENGADVYLTFVAGDKSNLTPAVQTISIELTCSNRNLPDRLEPGDVCLPGPDTPDFTEFENITRPTRSVGSPLRGGLQWRLLSSLSLNYLSLLDVKALRGVIDIYNFHAFSDRQARNAHEARLLSIVDVKSSASNSFWRGAPIRGRKVVLEMDGTNFAEGENFLFGAVLNEFLALYSTMNSFVSASMIDVNSREEYQWPMRLGQQIIL